MVHRIDTSKYTPDQVELLKQAFMDDELESGLDYGDDTMSHPLHILVNGSEYDQCFLQDMILWCRIQLCLEPDPGSQFYQDIAQRLFEVHWQNCRHPYNFNQKQMDTHAEHVFETYESGPAYK